MLDQVMPDMAGNDVLKTLKTDEDNQEHSGHSSLQLQPERNLVKSAIDEGAIDYLFKYQVEPKRLSQK
jgi:PleD family two-component response regulator